MQNMQWVASAHYSDASFVNQIVEFICLSLSCSNIHFFFGEKLFIFSSYPVCSPHVDVNDGMQGVLEFYERQHTISCKNAIVNSEHQLDESSKPQRKLATIKRFLVDFVCATCSPLNMTKSQRHPAAGEDKTRPTFGQIPSKNPQEIPQKLLHGKKFEFSFY